MVYAIGSGLALTVIIMLLISYLPGGITGWLVLIVFDGLWIGLLLLVGRSIASCTPPHLAPPAPFSPVADCADVRLADWRLFSFCTVGLCRIPYRRSARGARAAAVIQGDENVLFLHRKGPAEILLPAAIFALVGKLDEGAARLPFALASWKHWAHSSAWANGSLGAEPL